MSGSGKSQKLLFLIPEDWYVCSHRLPLITGARNEGLDVAVVTRVGDEAQPIRDAGAEVISSGLRRGFRNPWQDFLGLVHLVKIYRDQKPDIVHHVTPKSCLYGSLAARLSGVNCVINAMAGLGFLYTSNSWRARLARPLVTQAFKSLLSRRGSRMIVQNSDDGAFFVDNVGIASSKISLIRGSGVDTDRFKPVEHEPAGPVRFVFVARMIREKGVFELIEAARQLRSQRQDVEFVFAGEPDEENPSGISAAQLQAWHDEGVVHWLGRVTDVAAVLNSCHVAILPSYREGFPKSLLEAAACGLPLIATDAIGCREICLPEVNGLQVKVKDVQSIVAAVNSLADDKNRRIQFGRQSRQLVEDHFSEKRVVAQTVDLYREMLGREAERV